MYIHICTSTCVYIYAYIIYMHVYMYGYIQHKFKCSIYMDSLL